MVGIQRASVCLCLCFNVDFLLFFYNLNCSNFECKKGHDPVSHYHLELEQTTRIHQSNTGPMHAPSHGQVFVALVVLAFVELLGGFPRQHVAIFPVRVLELAGADGCSPVVGGWLYLLYRDSGVDAVVVFREKGSKRIRPEPETEGVACLCEGSAIFGRHYERVLLFGDVFGSLAEDDVGNSVVVGRPRSMFRVVLGEMDDVDPLDAPGAGVRWMLECRGLDLFGRYNCDAKYREADCNEPVVGH